MPTKLATLLFIGSSLVSSAALAEGAPPDQCFAAAEEGQTLRDAGKLTDARARFDQCAKDPCPALVRRDCSQWLEQLAAAWPTLVVRADAAGKDIAAVRVFVDGKLVAERLDGRPMEIEPGEHSLRYESDGLAPLEEKVVATSGEKNRVLNVHFAAPPTPLSPTPTRSKLPLVFGVSFSALAVGGIVTAAILGGTAVSTYNLMKSTCAATLPGTCDPSEVSAMRTKFLVGDVALGIGLASAVAATLSFIVHATSSKAPQTALRVGIGPTAGGGAAWVSGDF